MKIYPYIMCWYTAIGSAISLNEEIDNTQEIYNNLFDVLLRWPNNSYNKYVEVIAMFNEDICTKITIKSLISIEKVNKLCNGEFEKNGNKYYFANGQLHKDDGPAIELVNGTKIWYKNGKLREDEYSIEYLDGTKEWRKCKYISPQTINNSSKSIIGYKINIEYNVVSPSIYGILHRGGDKPAIINSDGTETYYYDGSIYKIKHKDKVYYFKNINEYKLYLCKMGINSGRIFNNQL